MSFCTSDLSSGVGIQRGALHKVHTTNQIFTPEMASIEQCISKQLEDLTYTQEASSITEENILHNAYTIQAIAPESVTESSQRIAATLLNRASPLDTIAHSILIEGTEGAHDFFSFQAIFTAISTAFLLLREELLKLFQDQKAIERESLFFLLSSLKYHECVSPHTQAKIIEYVAKENHEAAKNEVLQIATQAHLVPQDYERFVSLLESQGIIESLTFLYLLVILNTIIATPEWQELFTFEEKKRFVEAHALLQKTGSTRSLYSLFRNLYSRIQVKEWIEQLEGGFLLQKEEAEDYKEMISQLKKDLFSNNKMGFAENAKAFFSTLLSKRKDEAFDIKKSYIEEFQEFLNKTIQETSYDQLFATIALQFSQEKYISQWNSKAHTLLSLIQQENLKKVYDDICYDVNRISRMIGKSVELQMKYERLLENEGMEHKGHIADTYYSAQYGNIVSTWRKVNSEFLKLSKRIQAQPDLHAHCNCHYAKYKWSSLPDNTHGIRSLSLTPKSFEEEKEEATILGLFCRYGSGHKTALDAIVSYSQMNIPENRFNYHIRTLNVPIDVLLSVDSVHTILSSFFSSLNGETLYNFLLQKDCCALINFLKSIGSKEPTIEDKQAIKKLLRNAILKQNPDLLVSTYSFHGEFIEEVAEELGIPLIHTATDFDLSGRKKIPTHPLFKFAIPGTHEKMMESLKIGKHIREDQIARVGPLVRPEFEPKTAEKIASLRKEKGIDEEEKVVVFTSGGAGVPSRIPELLATKWNDQNTKIRIVVITGENTKYADYLLKEVDPRITNPNVSLNVYKGFVSDPQEMADLFHIANLGHGKPGGLTSLETISTGTPFLGDQLHYRFPWEVFNNDIIIDIGLGDKITPTDSEETILEKFKELLNKEKKFSPLFHDGTPTSKKFATLMSQMIAEGKEHEILRKNRATWDVSSLKELVNLSESIT